MAGIINGTTNFILSKMRDEGVGFAQALQQAQALGYAEADPTFDIGASTPRLITLLAANAFGMPVRFADAQTEGITALQGLDVACANSWATASSSWAWRGAAPKVSSCASPRWCPPTT